MSTSRRRLLVAGSAALSLAAGPRVHAQSAEAARKGKIDAMLQRAIDAGDVPGVVAMATDRNAVIYEGAFGKRIIGQPAAMTLEPSSGLHR
jgi:methyl acetate hydrolase